MYKLLLVLLPFLFCCSIHKKEKSISESINRYDFEKDSSLILLLDKLPNETRLAFGFVDGNVTNYLGIIKINDNIDTINNKDSIFEIGSISKVFTSLLFSKFILDGKVNINDPLQKYFDFPLNKGSEGFDPNKVLLIHLSNHTSGLPRLPTDLIFDKDFNMENPYANYSAEKLENHLKTNFYRDNEAGEKQSYSNLGAGILGYILEKNSGKTYNELLNKYIFSELTMQSSSIYIKDTNRLIRGRNNERVVENWEFSSLAGAGAIKSNVNDMVKFINYNIKTNDKGYLQMRDSTFSVNQNMNIGLGWHIINKNDKKLLFHNGGTGGYSSSIIIDVKNKKGIIILCNVSPNITAGKLDEISLKWINN